MATRSGRRANAEMKLRAFELVEVEGHSKTAAAELLGITRQTLARWLNEPGLADEYQERLDVEHPVAEHPKREETRGATKVSDDQTREMVLEAYQAGLNLDDCADYAGINRKTLHRWMKKAEQGLEPYASHRRAMRQAAATRKLTRLVAVEAGEPGWQGSAWTLERLNPDQFGKRLQADLQVANPAEDLSDEELAAIIEAGEA